MMNVGLNGGIRPVGENEGTYVPYRIYGITWGYLIDKLSMLLAEEGFS